MLRAKCGSYWKRGLSVTGRAGEAIPVRMVRRLHCSSTPPCRLPLWVKGISNMKRRMLWDLSNSVFLSCSSFSSKNGITWVTWMYAYLESRSLGLTFKWIKGMEYCYWCLKDSSNAHQSCVFPLRMSKSFGDSESLKQTVQRMLHTHHLEQMLIFCYLFICVSLHTHVQVDFFF